MPAKITSWTETTPKERSPPPPERISNHRWFTERMNALYQEMRSELPLYIQKTAEEKMRNHSLAGLAKEQEVMGLMLGGAFTHDGRIYAIVRDVVTTNLDASISSVRFHEESMEGLFDSLDDLDFEYSIVGWYHSHPGMGCFMSEIDVGTQQGVFNLPHHSALVLDPLNHELEAYYIHDNRVKLRAMGIYWDEYQDPYRG